MARIGRKNIKEQLTFNEVDLVAISLGSRKPTFVACLLIPLLYVPSLLGLKKNKKGKEGKRLFSLLLSGKDKGSEIYLLQQKELFVPKIALAEK